MKAAEYWKRRTVDLEHLLQARTTATMVEVNRMYAQGVEQINAQIERILRRYVKNGQISQAYALQLLSAGPGAAAGTAAEDQGATGTAGVDRYAGRTGLCGPD